MPDTPLLDRALAWFQYSGGDCWSTFMRYAIPEAKRAGAGRRGASGAHGDFTRGHYYLAKEAEAQNPTPALHRYVNNCIRYRRFLPEELRREGRRAHMEELFNNLADGFDGFYALDFAFINTRMRRSLPTTPSNVIPPIASPAMAATVFWQDPREKESSAVIRKMTNMMVPEWADVPYFHELAVGTDPNVTNKVTLKPAFWEINHSAFLDACEEALPESGITWTGPEAVEKELRDLPEGRNRTNSMFETIFWRWGAAETARNINAIKLRHRW
ncbi:hypothetical protein C1Y63_11140 [Corynebacterium sp. 13CS0277]|uniref:hypothetical protein n=1 Tax=Corynebacterium sp. 13CS0277 TaxID=2071994 RepID=UPI000D040D0F|nr:hypothetical protein [Corynebacterium sp. 13CS0277]PRQ10484.1 hypothetical protein C1Y63_11140 [Corynebacterium sp. 13CS0277]